MASRAEHIAKSGLTGSTPHEPDVLTVTRRNAVVCIFATVFKIAIAVLR